MKDSKMYYAEFKTDPVSRLMYRHDTRIYLSQYTGSRACGRCVGAFIGKNPGTASRSASGWGPINEDSTLRLIRSVWLKSLKSQIKPGDYIQVLNMFYLCDKDFSRAVKLANSLALHFPDPSESKPVDTIWWAIGDYDFANRQLGVCVNRILNSVKNSRRHVFYDPRKNYRKGRAVLGIPSLGDFCKHPIGMPHAPLAKVL